MIEIRKATATDAIHIALLGRITYTESHGHYINEKEDLLQFYNEYYSVSRIREEINDVKNIFWIVFLDELPIAFAKLSLDISFPKFSEIKSCKLQRLYILNDFIGLKDLIGIHLHTHQSTKNHSMRSKYCSSPPQSARTNPATAA